MAYRHAPYVTTWAFRVVETGRDYAHASRLSPGGDWIDHVKSNNRGEEAGWRARRGHRAGHAPSIPHRGRIVGGGASDRQRDLASFIFFGSLAVTALAGTVSIDAKRRRALGPRGCPSRHKPPSFRSRRLLRAAPVQTG